MKGCMRFFLAWVCLVTFGTAQAQDQTLIEIIETIFEDLVDPIFVVVSPDDDNVYVAAKNAILVYSRDAFGTIEPLQTIFDNVSGVDGLGGVSYLTISSDGKHLYACGEDEAKVGVFERNTETGTLEFVQVVEDDVDGIEGLQSPRGASITNDGDYLYVCASTDESIAIFARDSETGMLTFQESTAVQDPDSDEFSTPIRSVISPDDKHLYVAGDTGTITTFSRDSGTGALTFVQTSVAGEGSIPSASIGQGIAISQDGNTMYATANNFIVVFSRDSTTGSLTYLEHLAGSPDGTTPGLGNALSPVVSPLDDHVYLVSRTGQQGVVAFERFPPSGALLPLQFLQTQGTPPDGLLGAKSIALSQSGEDVYVVGDSQDVISTLSRDTDTGIVAFEGVVEDTENMVTGLQSAKSVGVSPDGQHLYVGAVSSIVSFNRDLGTGLINQIDIETIGDGSGATPQNVTAIDVSPDGKHVYSIAFSNRSIGVFSRGEIDGFLTFVERVSAGVDGVPAGVFLNINDGALTPDGEHYYAKSLNNLTALSRNSTSGELTHIATYTNGEDGIDSISGTSKLNFSPDGKNLYMTSLISNALVVFTRNETNGTLTSLEVIQLGTGDLEDIYNPKAAIVTPDGAQVYLIGQHAPDGGAIVLFSRNTTTGALTFEQAYLGETFQEPDVIPDFIIPNDIVISPDSSFVFVAVNTGEGTILAFARDPEAGTLRLIQTFEGDFQGFTARNALNIAIAPDSAYLHVTAQDANAIYTLERGVIAVLQGTVYEESSGAEVACGVVELANGDRSIVRTAVTDANGFYFFEELPFGVYAVRVLSPGLGEVTLEALALTSGQFIDQDFMLPPGAATADINGTVTDADTSEPLVGVYVEAFIGNSSVATTYTCATGAYELDLPGVKGDSVEVALSFSLSNYDTVERDVDVTPGQLLTVDQTLTKSVGFPGTLTGVVLEDDTETVITDANVTIRGGANASAKTDAQGVYSFDVPSGSYTIRASKDGYVGKTAMRSVAGSEVAVKTFSLEQRDETPPGDASDVNSDGTTNSVDIQLVINTVLGLPAQGIQADINADNTTNSVDIQLVINAVLGV